MYARSYTYYTTEKCVLRIPEPLVNIANKILSLGFVPNTFKQAVSPYKNPQ